MTKQVRRKLVMMQIMNKLDKYDRRIKQMAENAYKLRQFLDTLNKEENTDATHIAEGEGRTDSGATDRETGAPQLDAIDVSETVLEK